MTLEVVLFVGVALLFVLIEYAAISGLFAAIAGEQIEPCRRCHYLGLTVGGRIHAQGCPELLHERLLGAWRGWTKPMTGSLFPTPRTSVIGQTSRTSPRRLSSGTVG